jgi:hypothetical protein
MSKSYPEDAPINLTTADQKPEFNITHDIRKRCVPPKHMKIIPTTK